ncbi:MAG: glycosyltransferase family 61 protein, partial [Bacteroidia bacterium]
FTYLKAKDYLSAPDLLVPYYLAGSGRIHPVKFLTVRDLLVKHVKGTVKKDRIYVSRGRQKTRRVSNEQDVINVLKEFNFEVVFFEGLSFNEQMELVRNTRVMVSSHGANLTNLMFMQPGAKVLELIRDQQPNFCYWALASVCGLDYYYQLCNIAASDHLQVHTDRLRQNLKLLLND